MVFDHPLDGPRHPIGIESDMDRIGKRLPLPWPEFNRLASTAFRRSFVRNCGFKRLMNDIHETGQRIR